jgi:hypothetical protein
LRYDRMMVNKSTDDSRMQIAAINSHQNSKAFSIREAI